MGDFVLFLCEMKNMGRVIGRRIFKFVIKKAIITKNIGRKEIFDDKIMKSEAAFFKIMVQYFFQIRIFVKNGFCEESQPFRFKIQNISFPLGVTHGSLFLHKNVRDFVAKFPHFRVFQTFLSILIFFKYVHFFGKKVE